MDLEALRSLLGLDESQAQVLGALSVQGAMTAQGVATLLGKPRSQTYVVLRSLVAEGLLTEQPGRPLTFHPRPMWDALAGKQAELEAQVERIRTAMSRVERDPVPQGGALGPSSVSLFAGPVATAREAARLVAEAATHVVLTGYPLAKGAGGGGGGDELVAGAVRAAGRRGLSVRLYIPSEQMATPLGKELREAAGDGNVVPYDQPGLSSMASVTTDNAVLYVFAEAHRDHALDKLMGVRVRGSPLPAFTRTAVERLLGPAPPPRPEDCLEAYAQAVAGAKAEILLFTGQGWSELVTVGQAARMVDLHAQARQRGVRLKVLADDRPSAAPWDGQTDEMRLGRWLPGIAALVDGDRVFLAIGNPGEAPLLHASSDPNEAQWYRRMFERLWQQARPVRPARLHPEGRPDMDPVGDPSPA